MTNATLRPFDPAARGQETRPVVIEISEAHIQRFCAAIGETDPLCTDPAAARAMGHPGVLAPPTFAAALIEQAGRHLRDSGLPDIQTLVAGAERTLVHGEEEMLFFRPFHGGERIEVRARVVAIDMTANGRNHRARLVFELRASDGAIVLTVARTVLRRVPE